MFDGLQTLEELSLDNCGITDLEVDAFHSIPLVAVECIQCLLKNIRVPHSISFRFLQIYQVSSFTQLRR